MPRLVKSLTDRQGIALAEFRFTKDLGWIFREQPISDVGIDAIVEIVSEGAATGELVALQVKSGTSFFREETADGFVFRGDVHHLNYWLQYCVPVLLVLCSPTQERCWWQPLDYERIELTRKGWKITVPFTNELGEDARGPIRESVDSWRTLRRGRGSPAEDELSVVFQWLGRCKLVQRLNQLPRGAAPQFEVPDLLAVFDIGGASVPVLIEVTDLARGGVPSWDADYIASLEGYAKLLGLPLLIALKYVNFWTLFELRHLRKVKDRLTISFTGAMSETLLGSLAGDFSFRFCPGVGLHIKVRKLEQTLEGGFSGQIEEAYLLNSKGEKHFDSGGVFQLLMCIEQDVSQQEDDSYVVQSFIISEGGPAEFAHRALATLLQAISADPPSRHQVLIRKQLPLLFFSPHEAVRNGLEAGFIERVIRIRPKTEPTFMTVVQSADSA